jgi:uncharacterized protein (DUF1684 family)
VTDVAGSELFELLDWKRRVFDLYAAVRSTPDPKAGWSLWRTVRDDLFATHLQSPIPPSNRGQFRGLPFFDYDPAARVMAEVASAQPQHYEIATSGLEEGSYGFTRFAVARFELSGAPLELELYWLDGYGGGLFLPFRDTTSSAETYGAGRYLLDTVKGADLGMEDGKLVLDFNFSYNPSCAYDPMWVCPLAPPPNRLAVSIRSGERYP